VLWEDEPESTAVFGLLGVLVGGLIAGTFEIYADRRHQKRLLRAARRMLRLELDEARNFFGGQRVDVSESPTL
jgi:hypothetical protein